MRDEQARRRPRSSEEKSHRIDPSSGEDPSPRGLDREAGLLDQFRSWWAGSPTEGRRAARHAARLSVVWVGWWRAGDEFFAETARLSNISRGGALIVVRDPPPESRPVWICLGTPEPDECLAGRALEVRRARRGECAVRIVFCEPCPSRFLEAAVCGRTSERPGLRRPGR